MAAQNVFAIAELVHELAKSLDFQDRYRLHLVNKTAWLSRLFFLDDSGRYGQIQLTIEQQDVLDLIENNTKPYKVLQVPPSFGKTLLTLIHLLVGWSKADIVDDQDRVLLVMPPALIENWLLELERLFPSLIDPDPTKTSVFVQHESRPKHLKYDLCKDGIRPHWKLVFVTFRRVEEWYGSMHHFGEMVVDEAHEFKKWDHFLIGSSMIIVGVGKRIPRALLLTANGLNLERRDLKGILTDQRSLFIVRSAQILAHRIPDYHYNNVGGEILGCVVELFGKLNKVVVFLQKTTDYESYLTLKGVTVYEYKKAIAPITNFNQETGKCLLLVTFNNASTGHNILAEAAVFDRPELGSSDNFYQAMARLLRITNTNKKVDLYVKSENPLLLHYKKCVSEMKRKENVDAAAGIIITRINNGLVEKVLNRFSLDYRTLSELEFLWLCGPTNKSKISKKEQKERHPLQQLFHDRGLSADPRKGQIMTIYGNK